MADVTSSTAATSASPSKLAAPQADKHPISAATIINAEHKHLDKSQNLTALALSGGGIRSASFGLGVMQALVAGGLLKNIDYLSTSSGGGYIGASLTYFLHQGLPTQPNATSQNQPAGTEPHNFPFGITSTAPADAEIKASSNNILNFLRQHSRYLTPSKSLDGIALAGLGLRTVGVSLLVHFSFFVSFMLALSATGLVTTKVYALTNAFLNPATFLILAKTLSGIFAVVSFSYAIGTYFSSRGKSAPYAWRVQAQKFLGLLIKLIFLLLIMASLKPLHDLLKPISFVQNHPINAAGLSALAGTVMSFFKNNKQNTKPNFISKLLPIISSLLISYGLIFGAYSLLQEISTHQEFGVLVAATAFFLISAFLINTNYFGLHRMYRDRLMENFMPNAASILQNHWHAATTADKIMLQDVCDKNINPRPYHLINSNVVLADSGTARFSGRGGDSFVLTPLYCGSTATGYVATKNWAINCGLGISLPTAMAISGAALNPNAANNGQGVTRNFWVSGLLTIFNLRLGHWVSNPSRQNAIIKQPNFYTTGLFSSLFGVRHHERSRMLELTDGGHFDNLGLYELIRREVKLIIVADAGADGDFHFDDLGASVERVRVDFGVKIRFEDSEFNLNNLQPGTASVNKQLIDKYGLARHAFALGNIDYPNGSSGQIIYIKATLVDALPADLYTYKSKNPAFPHEPTADQSFDEIQFESYRELAYQLTWTMLNEFGEYKDKLWQPKIDSALQLII